MKRGDGVAVLVFWLVGFTLFAPAFALYFRNSLELTLSILAPIGSALFLLVLAAVAVRSLFR